MRHARAAPDRGACSPPASIRRGARRRKSPPRGSPGPGLNRSARPSALRAARPARSPPPSPSPSRRRHRRWRKCASSVAMAVRSRPSFEQRIEQRRAVAAAAFERAAVIVDLHRMRHRQRAPVLDRQARPLRMRDRHERAGLDRALRKLGAGLRLRRSAQNPPAGRPRGCARPRPANSPGACSSAPRMVVKRLVRKACVSTIGKP